MAVIKADHWIMVNGEYLRAGTHQIADKDLEALRPYVTVIEEPAKKKAPKKDESILE